MTKEINRIGDKVITKDHRKWIVVEISNEALSQINKIILGDRPDEGSKGADLREQVHNDCLELFKAFN